MARLRYRWLLPLGHLLVDVIVLSHFIWQGHQWQRNLCRQRPVVHTESSTQQGAVGWVVDVPPPEDFRSVLFGTLPAGLISWEARPRAYIQYCDQLWDPVWFSIHEGVALLFWFLLGGWLDSPGAPLRKLLGVYLALRLATAPLCWLRGLSSVARGVELLFWLVFFICALVQGAWWLLRRLRTRP